jgi:nucleotide-binding universal stress UspA family protein
MMYTRILVPLDGSLRALEAIPVARRLASLHGARLWLVTVAQPDADEATGRAILDAGRRAAGEDEVETTLVRADDVGDALARLDEADPDALVCLTTSGRGGIGRALFGSVAGEVVRRSTEGQVLVGPACDVTEVRPVGALVVCLDGTREGESALAHGARWNAATRAPLVLVRVVYPLPDPSARIPVTDGQASELGYVRALARRLKAEGREVFDVTVQHAHAPDALVDVASRWRDGLLMVASSHPSPLTESVLGSTATRIVRASTVPVLVTHRG